MVALNPQIFEMDRIKNLVGKLALNNYYQVDFSGLVSSNGSKKLIEHLKKTTFSDDADKSIVNTFITSDLGLLCTDASLPSSSYATAEVKDNFMGITQEFAHTRLYTDADFTFYIDSNYSSLRFFEGWMDFISGAGEIPQSELPGYYRRFQYPDNYKTKISITKFERNYKLQNTPVLVYTFINAFPKTLTPVPVTYGSADLLKVTVSINYDRYFVERKLVSQDLDLLQKQYQKQLSGQTGGGTLSGAGTFQDLNRANREQGLA